LFPPDADGLAIDLNNLGMMPIEHAQFVRRLYMTLLPYPITVAGRELELEVINELRTSGVLVFRPSVRSCSGTWRMPSPVKTTMRLHNGVSASGRLDANQKNPCHRVENHRLAIRRGKFLNSVARYTVHGLTTTDRSGLASPRQTNAPQ
jgi:hypothetical protein